MFLRKDKQTFAQVGAVIVALQGLAWLALAITGIVVNSSPPDKMSKDISTYERYSEYLSRIIYDDFLGGGRDKVIRPKDFVAFLWIYTILSALWVGVSIDQYAAIHNNKPRQAVVAVVLGVIVLVTSIIDLVFFALLARDLDTCPFNLTIATEVTSAAVDVTTTSEATVIEESLALSQSSLTLIRNTGSTSNGTAIDCQLANGIIMTIAARGYVLWIINSVMAICLIVMGGKALRTPSLLTYGNNTIPRVKVPELRKQASPTDLVFLGDNDIFSPPLPQPNSNRNRNSTPIALTNKNQSLYY